MAETPAQESQPTKPDMVDPSREDEPIEDPLAGKSPICRFAAKLSDRAIQRITGGNAFLRGRIYARRKAVEDLVAKDDWATAQITVRNADEPYRMKIALDDEHKVVSSCTCPGFRGPTGHCKHIAAVLVSLRDRERPARPKGQAQQQPQRKKKKKDNNGADAVHVPQTVSVGGKRRRSRRRRRGAGDGSKIEVLSGRDLTGPRTEDRGTLEAWLPADVLPQPYDFEYRLTVRSASIAVTAVLAGTRSAVNIVDALASFNAIAPSERPLLRAMARHPVRGQPATAELRGEDASEFLAMLESRRVLIEPQSMELRFDQTRLKPVVELDLAGGEAVRIRVTFTAGGRPFALSKGAWFEGTPGYHIDVEEGIARKIVDAVTPAWHQRLSRSPTLVAPLDELPRLLSDFIPRAAASLGAELPDLNSVADLIDAQPSISLQVDGDIVGAIARLKVSYDEQEFPIPPSGFPSPLAFLPPLRPGGRPRVVRRDVGAEMTGVQLLMNLGFEVDESGDAMEVRGDQAIAFWTEGIGTLPEDWDRYIPDDLVDVTIRNTSVSPQMRVSSGVDWMSLNMTFDAGGVVVDETELRMCLEKGRRLVQLSDGTFAPVDPEEVGEVLARLAEIEATSGGENAKLSLSQAGRVQDLLSLVSRQKVTPKAKDLFGKLADIGDIPNVAKPRALKAKLRDYQKKGFNWLVFIHNLGSGGILADDMGLGKTLQAIALILWNRSQTKAAATKAASKSKSTKKKKVNGRPTLVIAPTSVVPNWQREIEKFAPGLKTLLWQGPNRFVHEDEIDNVDVVISSYALLRRDEEFLQSKQFRYLILDEAQHIKNPMSATAKAAKRIGSDRRLAMTGTPIENRLSEFWSIIDFVSPGLLGDLKTFEENVARPIDRGDQKAADKLRKTIQPFVLRRTKVEVAPELPAKIQQEIVVPLADEQQQLYSQILREVRKSVYSEVEKKGVAKVQIQILAALTRLRQVACDPRLMKIEGAEWDDNTSGKLAALREIVAEAKAGGHRVLIFSQFVTMLKLIRDAMDEDGVTYEYLDGSTKNRLEKVDNFNDNEDTTAFLISLKAGGTGLNLTGADTVIHFDPWWNPAVEDQATDRAHRIGQTRTVNVYRLIAKGTVEEKILELSAKKRALMENVLSTEGSPLKGLTKADIDDLFSE